MKRFACCMIMMHATVCMASSFIELFYPRGGEVFAVETSVEFIWSSSKDISHVDILLYYPGGSRLTSGYPNVGYIDWELKDMNGNWLPVGYPYKIGIYHPSDITVYDEAEFAIYDPSSTWIDLTFPLGGEIIDFGSTIELTWLSAGISHVDILCYYPGGSKLTSGHPNSGSKLWELKDMEGNWLPPGENYYVRVIDSNPYSGAEDKSNFFTIIAHSTQITDHPDNHQTFSLKENYPNPFNAMTHFSYSLGHEAPVCLTVFDVTGTRQAILVDERQSGGDYTVRWDATQMGSGVYFIELRAGSYRMVRKAILVK